MKKIGIGVLIILSFVSINLLPAASQPADSTTYYQAMTEGKLVFYSSAPRWASQRILYEFQENYPFIETELHSGGSNQLDSEIQFQIDNNRVIADVIHLSDVVGVQRWKKDDKLLYYPSPEYAYYPDDYKDTGYWACVRNVTVCLAYNSEAIPATLAPKTWKDLIETEWDQKIYVGNPFIYGTRMVQYYALREKFGKSFWDKVAQKPIKVEMDSGQISQFFTDPETPLTLTYLGYFFDKYSIKLRYPVRAVWPEDGVPIVPCPIAILKDAPHPNTAKLFIDFILSAEGQALFQVLVGDYSVRQGIPPLPGKVPFEELNTITIDWEDYFAKKEQYLVDFMEAFGDSVNPRNTTIE